MLGNKSLKKKQQTFGFISLNGANFGHFDTLKDQYGQTKTQIEFHWLQNLFHRLVEDLKSVQQILKINECNLFIYVVFIYEQIIFKTCIVSFEIYSDECVFFNR